MKELKPLFEEAFALFAAEGFEPPLSMDGMARVTERLAVAKGLSPAEVAGAMLATMRTRGARFGFWSFVGGT